MVNFSLLAAFIPTFFLVSFTPGMCMTLSLTLGMSIGLRRTLWMMLGELVGVALVSIAAVVGVATIMLNSPSLFTILKLAGGGYLLFLGIQLWLSRGKMAVHPNQLVAKQMGRKQLISQGFVTAVANPKGWAFMISLLPPFIDDKLPLVPQLTILLTILLTIEFSCLVIYASSGNRLRVFLEKKDGTRLLNRIAGILMIGVGIWLALG